MNNATKLIADAAPVLTVRDLAVSFDNRGGPRLRGRPVPRLRSGCVSPCRRRLPTAAGRPPSALRRA